MTEIVYAGYGYSNQVNDVTDKVKQQYRSGMREFKGLDSEYGDPSVGNIKSLYIVWQNAQGVKDSGVSIEQKVSVKLPD
jgi:hypothetical protein